MRYRPRGGEMNRAFVDSKCRYVMIAEYIFIGIIFSYGCKYIFVRLAKQ